MYNWWNYGIVNFKKIFICTITCIFGKMKWQTNMSQKITRQNISLVGDKNGEILQNKTETYNHNVML